MGDGLEVGVLVRWFFNIEYKKVKKVYEDMECLFDYINKLFLLIKVNVVMVLLGLILVSLKEYYFVYF